MIEVFKTNVNDPAQAAMLIDRIHKTFNTYTANFDLQDCDRILRVKCNKGAVASASLIDLLKQLGFFAEALPDEYTPAYPFQLSWIHCPA